MPPYLRQTLTRQVLLHTHFSDEGAEPDEVSTTKCSEKEYVLQRHCQSVNSTPPLSSFLALGRAVRVAVKVMIMQ